MEVIIIFLGLFLIVYNFYIGYLYKNLNDKKLTQTYMRISLKILNNSLLTAQENDKEIILKCKKKYKYFLFFFYLELFLIIISIYKSVLARA